MSLQIDKLIRSRRRTVSLQIDEEGLLVVRAPHKVPDKTIHDFIAKKQVWIQKHQGLIRQKQEILKSVNLSQSKGYYLGLANRIFTERVEVYASKLGLTYNKVRVSSARRLWGSCTFDGTISLNWRLVLTTPQVIDYVVVHELVHLAHRNHSRRFWSRVEAHYPDYRLCRQWLKANNHILQISI